MLTTFGLGVAVGTIAGTIVSLVLGEWLQTQWPA